MNFLSNVIRIFFRNKGTEIKGFFFTRCWYNIAEGLIIIPIALVVVCLLICISWGTGYILMDVLDWVDVTVDGGESSPYIAIGMLAWLLFALVLIAGYGVLHFIKWIWSNIKIAIAEAKEI